MQRTFTTVLFIALLAALCPAPARAGKVALLLEEPYGHFGSVNPTGHAAIYLSDVCAETPVRLRRCDPGERGVVLSRYHKIDGYDWIAMPLLAYLYAVNSPDEIPTAANVALETRLRDEYRRTHLIQYVPDDPRHEAPTGDWTQLVGESYDRKIYGFSLETRPVQDDALIDAFNDSRNRTHFNLFFNNCANFAAKVLDFYFPHAIHRNFIADAGLMTPKQAAHSLQKYAKRHHDLEYMTFVIPQVPGTIHRSTPVHGVLESLVETKKYAVPLACLHPIIAGSLLAVYFGDGRFHPAAQMETTFDPREDPEPGVVETAKATPANRQDNTGSLREVALRP